MSKDLLPFNMPENENSIIKVFGVGGGGCNAVNHMFKQGIKDVNFVVTNTDAQALEKSPVPIKVQLGATLTEGRGAGNVPDKGKQSAIENIEDIKNILSANTKMVFITAGMGGGTGTGAAPIIAKAAKELDILTIAIVTIPFRFEGQRRIKQAYEGINNLQGNVDSLLVINNEKLREIHGDLKISEAFSHADDILTVAAKGIAEIITEHGHLNVDFADVQTVMKDSGVALMGSANASGADRAIDAIKSALNSPLLNDNDIHGAKNILLNITSGTEEVSMDEIGQINEYVQESAGFNADLIWGNSTDPSLGDEINVSVIATGFKTDIFPEIKGRKQEEEKDILNLEEDEIQKKANSNIFVLNENDDISNLFESKEALSTRPKQEVVVEKATENFELTDIDNTEVLDSTKTYKVEVEQKKVVKRPNEPKSFAQNYSENIEEWENVPAYLRKNKDIGNQDTERSEEISKYSLSNDKNKHSKISSDNSFLHDRVD